LNVKPLYFIFWSGFSKTLKISRTEPKKSCDGVGQGANSKLLIKVEQREWNDDIAHQASNKTWSDDAGDGQANLE
jgi:hypothetical protein